MNTVKFSEKDTRVFPKKPLVCGVCSEPWSVGWYSPPKLSGTGLFYHRHCVKHEDVPAIDIIWGEVVASG